MGPLLKDHCCAANHPFRGSTGIDGMPIHSFIMDWTVSKWVKSDKCERVDYSRFTFEHRSLVTPTFDGGFALITLVFDQSARQNSDADRRRGRIRLAVTVNGVTGRSPIQRTAGSAFASHFEKVHSSTSWLWGLDPRRRAALCPSVWWG